MGSTISAELPYSSTPCAVIQLRSWKGVDMERVIAVPVTESVFQSSYDHPLFQLLLCSRNEPAVRHWYDAPHSGPKCPSPCSECDRAQQLENPIAADAFYQELFPSSETVQCNSSLVSESSSCGDRTRTSSITEATTTSRWMIISLATVTSEMEAFLAGSKWLSVAQATSVCTSPGVTAQVAGYFEARHAPLRTAVSYFMIKTFSTEAKSLVLFQIAAFMESTRLKENNIRPVSPAVLELSLRHGDMPTLRMLDWAFRRLLPVDRCSTIHQYASVKQDVSASYPRITINFSSVVVSEILSQLEFGVDSTSQIPSSTSSFLLVINQRLVTRFVTPFTSFIEEAKPMWTRENAIVQFIQPNVRMSSAPPSVGFSTGSNSPLERSSTVTSDLQVKRNSVDVATIVEEDSSSGNTDSSRSSVHDEISTHMHNNIHMMSPTVNKVQSSSTDIPSLSQPIMAQNLNVVIPSNSPSLTPVMKKDEATFVRIPPSTPVHFWNYQTGMWMALWYTPTTGDAQLQVSHMNFSDEGKVLLETSNSLSFVDREGNTIQAPAHNSIPNRIAVAVGCHAQEVGLVTGKVLRSFQLFSN